MILRIRDSEAALADLARRDRLTGLLNRRAYDEAIADALARRQRLNEDVSILLLDIDHFKPINDTHGHPIGDRVLLCVAQWLNKAVRQTDVVARYGGEEFALLFQSAGAAEMESRLAALLEDIAASAFEYDVLGRKERVKFTVSCGLADFVPADSEDDFVKRADEALYEAKRKGRNRVVARRRSFLDRVLAWGE